MDAWYRRFSVACDIVEFEFILFSPLLVWSSLPLAFPGDVAYAYINIQEVA